MAGDTDNEALVRDLARDLDRVADRLRTLSAARIAAPVPGWASRAAAARGLAQACADAAARLDGEPDRAVPVLSDLAVGDQVAVCGHDLVAALTGSAGRGDDAHVRDAAAEVSVAVDALRRLL